jgi:hypothetical protein
MTGECPHDEIAAKQDHPADKQQAGEQKARCGSARCLLRQSNHAKHGGRMDHQESRGRLEQLPTAKMCRRGGSADAARPEETRNSGEREQSSTHLYSL